MMVPESAKLMYMTNKNTKFIITLRDPVDRAYSQFRYMQKLYYTPNHINHTMRSSCPDRKQITFKQEISEEFEVLRSCKMIPWSPEPPPWLETDSMPSNCSRWTCYDPNNQNSCNLCFPQRPVHLMHDVKIGNLAHGLYSTHLYHFFKYFPRENFYIIRFEDIVEKGEYVVLNDLCEWLGIPTLSPQEWGDLTAVNSNNYPPMDDEERKFLENFFGKPNRLLEKMLFRSFNWSS